MTSVFNCSSLLRSVVRCLQQMGQISSLTAFSAGGRAVVVAAVLAASLSVVHAADLFGVRHDGKEIAAGELTGWKLVYFGFTHCPEICPTSLHSMSEAVNQLGPLGERITPVFVTVDPERDTPEVMAKYVAYFHPRLIGISPHPDQLPELAKAWRVKYARVDMKDDGFYSMDHTAVIFLTDAYGSTIGRFQHDLSGEELARQIRASILADR